MNKKIIVGLSVFLFLNFTYPVYSAQPTQEEIQRYSAYYSNGVEYLKNNQYSSAIIEFKKVLRVYPYDANTINSLANTYLARADYYRQTTKEIKKALVDYKSAVFYSKYWTAKTDAQGISQLATNAQKNVNDLEKRISGSISAQDRLKNGKILKAQGELAASGYEYQQLKNTQYKAEAYKNLGNIYKNLNNLSYAIDSYKTAISYSPQDPELHLLYGVILDEANNFDASIEQYNLALKYGDKSPELLEILENKWTQNIVSNPTDAQSYINLGAIYQKQGNYEQAKNQYLKAYQIDNTDETALLNLASLYHQQKQYYSEIEMYDKLLLKNPKNIEIINYKADAYKSMSKFDEALKQYENILAIEPNNQAAKNNADEIILNNYSGAKLQNYLLTKAQSNPQNYEAQFNYALELHKNKDYNNALIYYKRALAINPSKEEVYINMAQIYIDKKDYKNADLICQNGLMMLPNNDKLNEYTKNIKSYMEGEQYSLAAKYFNEKQYNKAIAEYLKIPNQTKEVKLAMAGCYWQLNDYSKANQYYLELLNSEPNNVELLESSAWAYYSLNDMENTKKMANKALAINKNDTDMTNLLAQISENELGQELNNAISQYEQGKYQEALNMFNKLTAKGYNEEYSLYYKGLCLDGLKKPQEAIKQYKLLISKKPNFKEAYYSLAVDLDNQENYKEAIGNYEKFVSLNENKSDEMVKFSASRTKELKEYLSSISKK